MVYSAEQLAKIFQFCRKSKIGKILPDALYVHVSALDALDADLQEYERLARSFLPESSQPTLVKFSTEQPKLSYLYYPNFDEDPHPALKSSIQVNLQTQEVNQRNYQDSQNPFILHRKETFVTSNYPLHPNFSVLTEQEEKVGLLSNPRSIGTLKAWQQKLNEYQVTIENHQLISLADKPKAVQVDRHKAAISRSDLSKPVRLALEAGLFTLEADFFDYGCGQGGDVQRIADLGYSSNGFDPFYQPHVEPVSAEIVNLGYIINVIESQAERREALVEAWRITRRVLIVAAQVIIYEGNHQIAYGDGVITSRNTFQKFYDQEELKIYIDQVLAVDAIPVALGIYFVFRDESEAQSFRASRFHSRVRTPQIRLVSQQFEEQKEILTPLMNFMTERGRLPVPGELIEEEPLISKFGSLRRAFQIVLKATDSNEWDDITEKRRQDLLVYLALTNFGRRPKLKELPVVVQDDFKLLFGSYQNACVAADMMLMSLGDLSIIDMRCKQSLLGKKLSNALLVHVSAIPHLDPLLRLYEGCAARTIGRPEEANVVKFHTSKPKISYLVYSDFDRQPHPILTTSMQIDLRDLNIHYRDFDPSKNPPILHQKDLLVSSEYPLHKKFHRLSQQELDWGLLNDWSSIGHQQDWLKHLEQNCATLQGHRLVWSKDADPYKIKLLKSAIRKASPIAQIVSNPKINS
jgi:DNA phosphorothioation-associated putative methyltransferase